MLKRIVVLILAVFVLKGCTRDDICPGDAGITPNLVITFNDFNIPSKRKKVKTLTVETDYEDRRTIFSLRETDTIALPLNINSDTTKYRFIQTTTIENQDPIINIDHVIFTYNRKEKYVNRACGFSLEFENLDKILSDPESENWIKRIVIKSDSIVDEKQAHISILH